MTHFLLLATAKKVFEAKDEYGSTPLSYAAGNNAPDVARLLIDLGADIESKNNPGDTPLHWAAAKNSLDVARLLVDRGADIDGIDLGWMK